MSSDRVERSSPLVFGWTVAALPSTSLFLSLSLRALRSRPPEGLRVQWVAAQLPARPTHSHPSPLVTPPRSGGGVGMGVGGSGFLWGERVAALPAHQTRRLAFSGPRALPLGVDKHGGDYHVEF